MVIQKMSGHIMLLPVTQPLKLIPVKSSSSMTREKNQMVQDQNSTVGRNAPQYKQVNHQTT